MKGSTPFTPYRIAIAFILGILSMAFIFQRQLTNALITIHHRSCENIGTQHNGKYHLRTFSHLTSLGDLESGGDDAWSRLTPNENGDFLWLQYNETFKIPWGISMFHGIHCLQMLRSEFQSQLGLSSSAGHQHKRNVATAYDNHGSGTNQDSPYIAHLGHCFAYIAEMLQCAGDGTIERPLMRFDELTGDLILAPVEGAGTQHQCRDTRRLWVVAEETEQRAARMWDYEPGDTIESVFGDL